MEPETPAIQELIRSGVTFRIFQHNHPIESLEQAAIERGQDPQQVVRSILFRISAQEYVMVLMPGPRQISWKALRMLLAQNRISMASDDELLSVTGYQPGTVSPFGLPNPAHIKPLRILAERSLFDQPEISLGSGIRGTAIILTPAQLLRAIPNLEVVKL